jgi:Na+/melibiose symporter-like transporter
LVALRGGAITLIAFLFFFFMSGVDRMMYARPYLAAVGLSFLLHYAIAWFTVRRLRRRYEDRKR